MSLDRIKRIVIVTQDYPPSSDGISTYFSELTPIFKSEGFDVLVVTRTYAGYDSYDDSGIPTIRLSHKHWSSRKFPRIYKAIKPLVGEGTLFFCAHWRMGVACRALALGRKIDYFVAAHGNDAIEKSFLNKILQKTTYETSNGVISVSSFTTGLLEKVNLRKTEIATINLGIRPGKYYPRERDPEIEAKYGFVGDKRILTLGRVVERKGHDTTVKALKLMQNKDATYYVAGKGGYVNDLHKLVEKLNLTNRVKFLGYVPEEDKPEVYNCVDVFCMPSRKVGLNDVEGFGLTYVEAGACGVPSIGGADSGAEDAIIDGETGLIVDPYSPEAVAVALDKLFDSHGLRLRIGDRAIERANNELTWENCAKNILNFFDKNL